MNPNIDKSLNSFRRTSFVTVVAVYFLILVGGIVRSTGSGMGCPDWPKCFGSVIPPTSVNQLPLDYQEKYLAIRLAKNERFVALLEKLGFTETAEAIANDKSILVEEEFNAVKTWIEYLNRLVGVVIGLLIVQTVWKSLKLRNVDPWIFIYSIIALILVVFTAWIGSIVVSTNLLAWMITFHMLLALGVVAFLLLANHRSERLDRQHGVKMEVPRKVQTILILGTILMLIQVVLGTQVREQIDRISFSLGGLLREEWVERVGVNFLIHRSFSLLLLSIHGLYFFWAFKFTVRKTKVNLWSQVLIGLIILEIATGMSMAYFGIPAFLQPVHLLLGSLILGVEFVLILQLKDHIQFKIN
ncbi:cytochrome c oxidase assembly protein subunit 15 [Algoriphagus boseongensis]|uniref:Cytochrome c oxidase assembly protein subunit 15 n=1 Tax=Algoriphagus boseongensis TaxID=1442587 RepID=A0A4R6T6M2_9BACT|nr:COX15/CtaA family protein [Algoriphagus boseongensis]TDQ16608.1 cytochrome c oxidase assembly protein subunit 15 [Algoriphagus boseongensis]